MNDLKVSFWLIDKVIPYPGNARKIPHRAVDKLGSEQESGEPLTGVDFMSWPDLARLAV
jgi:hypothetical protein